MTYVKRADLDDVVIATNDPLVIASISAIGFAYCGVSGHYVIHTSDDDEKASVFKSIRVLGIPFMGGRAWSPAEVFEYLRDDLDLISGAFECIVWTEPGKARIESW